jgi:hypothetical protein
MFSGHPYRWGRPYHPYCAPPPSSYQYNTLFREEENNRNRTQQPPFTREQGRSDLNKKKTIVDSSEDMPPLDHPLIHHTPLVLRERDSYL